LEVSPIPFNQARVYTVYTLATHFSTLHCQVHAPQADLKEMLMSFL